MKMRTSYLCALLFFLSCSSQKGFLANNNPTSTDADANTDIAEDQDCIPELEAVLQEDGSYIYEEVKSCPSTSTTTSTISADNQTDNKDADEGFDIMEDQDCIPELEAVLQEDGSYLYEEVKSCPVEGKVVPVAGDNGSSSKSGVSVSSSTSQKSSTGKTGKKFTSKKTTTSSTKKTSSKSSSSSIKSSTQKKSSPKK